MAPNKHAWRLEYAIPIDNGKFFTDFHVFPALGVFFVEDFFFLRGAFFLLRGFFFLALPLLFLFRVTFFLPEQN